MSQQISSDYFLRRLGIYRNLNTATINFANITFRVVGGILGGLPPESISFFTSVERFIWMWFEVPGGRLADQWGRVKTAILGYSLVLVANLSLYLGYLSHNYHWQIDAFYFIALMGLFIGIGAPLISGSVESYYQELYELHLKKEGKDLAIAQQSFSTSMRYGRYLPLLYVILTYTVLIGFHHTIGAGHSFLVYTALDLVLVGMLIIDIRRFSDPSSSSREVSSLNNSIQQYFSSRSLKYSSYFAAMTWTISYIIGYYGLVSLGRPNQDLAAGLWTLLICYSIGNKGIGPLLVGSFTPKVSERLNPKQGLWFYSIFLFILSGLYLLFIQMTPTLSTLIIVSVFFGAFSRVPISGIMLLAKNIGIEGFEPKDYATILSLQLIPAQITIFLYSSLLTAYFNGAPQLKAGVQTVIGGSILCLVLAAFYSKKS